VTRKLLLSWDDFDEAVFAGTEHILLSTYYKRNLITGIYGIPRGGLVLAVALSHHTRLPLTPVLQEGCVIVDDVLESGVTMERTLNAFYKQFPDGCCAAWVWVTKNPTLGSGYGRFEDPNMWVVFPWENWQAAEEDKKLYDQRSTSR